MPLLPTEASLCLASSPLRAPLIIVRPPATCCEPRVFPRRFADDYDRRSRASRGVEKQIETEKKRNHRAIIKSAIIRRRVIYRGLGRG